MHIFLSVWLLLLSLASSEAFAGGRLTNSVNALGESTAYIYDAAGRRTNVVQWPGWRVPYAGGYANLATAVVTPPNTGLVITRTGYDAGGNLLFTQDNLGRILHYDYDPANRRIATYLPATTAGNPETVVRTFFDSLGRKLWEQDAAGILTAFGYDGSGRLSAITNDWKFVYPTNEVPVVTRYRMDELGQSIQQTDALGRKTTYEYDALGRRVFRSLPGGAIDSDPTTQAAPVAIGALTERVSYSTAASTTLAGGGLVGVNVSVQSVRSFNGLTRTLKNDLLDRLAQQDLPTVGTWAARSQYFVYDVAGRRTQGFEVMGTTTNRVERQAYDQLGRLRVRQTPEGTLNYDFDLAGRISLLTARTNFTLAGTSPTWESISNTMTLGSVDQVQLSYDYDAVGRLTGATDLVLGTVSYGFDGVGSLSTLTYPNGVNATWTYNTRNQLTNLVWAKSGVDQATFGYALLANGQRSIAQEMLRLDASDIKNWTHQWVYDSRLRLKQQLVSGLKNGGQTANNEAVNYTFDLVGNRLTRNANLGLAATSQAYDNQDRINSEVRGGTAVTTVYDNDGNPSQAVAPAAQTANPFTYTYDAWDRLSTAVATGQSQVTSEYDLDGRRIRKAVTGGVDTRYLIDDRNPTGYAQVVAEFSVSGSWSLTKTYAYGLDLLRQRERKAGWIQTWYGVDGLGSTRILWDAAGISIGRYAYEAGGRELYSDGTSAPRNVYRFTGEQWDGELGMYYLRARQMDPDRGRFLNMDTFEGNSADPGSLHKYLYASANPVNRIDPSGHSDFSIGSFAARFAIQGSNGAVVSGGIDYAVHRSFNRAAKAGGFGFVIGGTLGTAFHGAKALLAIRGAAAAADVTVTAASTQLLTSTTDAALLGVIDSIGQVQMAKRLGVTLRDKSWSDFQIRSW